MSEPSPGQGPRLSEEPRLLRAWRRVYLLLLRAYPADFRRELGADMADAHMDQCRDALRHGGRLRLAATCARAAVDAVRNGLAERLEPAGGSTARRTRRDGRTTVVEAILRDLREAARQLRRAPVLGLVAVAAIAVGIGAFGAIYAVVDSLLLEPMPYEDPDELVWIWRNYTWADFPRGWTGGVEILGLRESIEEQGGESAFEGVVGIRSGRVNLASDDDGEPVEIGVMLVGDHFFDLVGVQPALGRAFLPGEDEPGAQPVVVLGHALWQQRYGGDPDVVGHDIRVDGQAVPVVGVMPPGFEFAKHSSLSAPVTADAYMPHGLDLSQVTGGAFAALGRLRDGVSRERAQAELDAVIAPIDREIFDRLGLRLWFVGLHEDLIGDALREAATRGGTGGAARKARSGLVVAQVAMTVILLAAAAMLGRSFLGLLASEPGFEPGGALTVRIPLAGLSSPDDDAAVLGFYSRLRAAYGSLPGVGAVGATSALPLTGETNQTAVSFPGADGRAGAADGDPESLLIDLFEVTPGTFEALGTRVLEGRGFRSDDDAAAPPVAVIDQTLASRFFPNESPIGREMLLMTVKRTVVGVVDQPRLYDVHRDDRPQVFLPLAQRPRTSMSFVLRTERDPLSLAGEVRRVTWELDPDQPVADVRTLESIVSAALREERLSLLLIAGFAVAATILAALGLYGVISNSVTQRTREMGVRMALGADARSVRSLVVGQGLRLTAAGLLLGLAGALATARLFEAMLVGVEPGDPLSLAIVAGGLAVVATLASWIPARRATRIDPLVALRAE